MRLLGFRPGIVAFHLLVSASVAQGAAAPAWRVLPGGVAVRQVEIVPSTELPVTAWLVRCDPDTQEVRVLRAEDPSLAPTVAVGAGALAAVNASYFDAAGRPLGLLVTSGRTLQAPNRQGWAFAAIAGGRLLLRTASAAVPDGTREAAQAGPILVAGGRVRAGGSSRTARRAFIANDATGRIVLGATDGPVTLATLAGRLAASEDAGGAGLVDVLNLDGGSSTQLYVAGDTPPLHVPGVTVPVFFAIVPKAPVSPSGP